MPINQITTSNTFQQWLIATQGLISTANTLTDGNGQTFIANTILEVSGTGATFVVKNTATINVISANTITTGNLTVTSNIAAANITNSLKVGGDAIVYGNANIVGDLTVTGNLSLDTIGFDDLSVSGSGSFGNTLSVVGQTTLSNLNVTNIIVSSNIARANITTSLEVGTTANILGSVYIAGDLTIGGNTILDSVGFDDLTVSGSATIANNATISGDLTVLGNTNLNTANINVITGNAVNQFDPLGISVVMAIALG
jgi:UDP-3-O-[3-hydroxymyristoyl] glucosamine N-acyltransferase